MSFRSEKLLNEFKRVHLALEEDPKHEYFKKNYFNQVESLYRATNFRKKESPNLVHYHQEVFLRILNSLNMEQLQRFRRQLDRMPSMQRLNNEIED